MSERHRRGIMAHTFTKNHQHIVFSTAGRRKLIERNRQPELWAYIAGICRNHGIFVRAIGGVDDHVHLLVEILPIMAIAKAVATIKANSSKWMNETGSSFAWQKGYAAFSVSASNIAAVERYIRNQEAHHQKISYEDELLALLRKHGISFDSKFVFG
jgi:putative transposase